MKNSIRPLIVLPLLPLATIASAETTLCNTIPGVPMTISAPGIYCFKQDLATAAPAGNAITINANSVTIDMNGFKLGGIAGGASTQTIGIYANGRRNITIRNGSIRGFFRGVFIDRTGGVESDSSGHVLEDLRIEGSRRDGILVRGIDTVVRRNLVTDTGSGVSTNASGVTVEGDAASVSDNMVNRVSETGLVVGIDISSSNGAIIERNDVREVTGGSANHGIRTSGVADIIKENKIVNASAGAQTGISATGTKDICTGNIVSETFSTTLAGCEDFSGNVTF